MLISGLISLVAFGFVLIRADTVSALMRAKREELYPSARMSFKPGRLRFIAALGVCFGLFQCTFAIVKMLT